MSAAPPSKPGAPQAKPPSPAKGNMVIGVAAATILAGLLATSESSNRHISKPYYDQVGVLTVCDGLTGPWIDKNHRYSVAECAQRKRDYIRDMTAKMGRCVGPLTDDQWIAWGHFAYNIGTTRFCNSTAAKHLRAGNHMQACAQIMNFTVLTVPSRGKVNCKLPSNRKGPSRVEGCDGIMNRRDAEYKMCMKAVPRQ